MFKSVILLTVFALAISVAHAQVPDSISFQGYLTNSLGGPLDSSGVVMTFRLYKGNSVVYIDTHHVTVSDGVFSVLIGKNGAGLDSVAFNRPIDLGITIGTSELSPRTPLVSSAFAMGVRGMYAFEADDGNGRAMNVIGGSSNNSVGSGVVGATIGGGGGIAGPYSAANSVLGDWGTVGGGFQNTASGYRGTIAGGSMNLASGDSSTVSGGAHNAANSRAATVGGGSGNVAGSGTPIAGAHATISGGILNTASGGQSTVSGGGVNVASGASSSVGGGFGNVASGNGSTIPGGQFNRAAGDNSFTAGFLAKAKHHGVFVWQDNTGTNGVDSLASTAANQFLARASGGFKFITESAPGVTTGAELPAGSGTWTSLSSESSKTSFRHVDVRTYLDRVASLKLKEWSYKTEPEVTHVGPMSEDFHALFGHGPNDKGISGVDADGVALAAIQGLYELVKEQQALIEGLQTENKAMRIAMGQAGIQ